MELRHLFLILFLVDAVVNVIANVDEKKHIQVIYFTKPLLMPLLILYFVTGDTAVDWWIVAALGFGFCGDVFLMLPGEKESNFILGLVAFLVNQLLFVVAFLRSVGDPGSIPVWLWALGIPYLVFGVAYFRLLAPGLGKLKGPVIVYMVVILAMGVTALARWPFVPPGSFWLVFAGSVLFVGSDSVLAWDRFRKQLPLGRMIVMATYIAAQFLIASGFKV